MEFKDNLPLYIQMAERLCDEVLAGTYRPNDRVPGVREYAAQFGVNVNTAVRAYDWLVQRGIIYAQRSTGYYITTDASLLIREERRRSFCQQTLPDLFRQMHQLGVTIDEVVEAWKKQNK